MPSALDQLYSGLDRFRHRVDALFGRDTELDELSDKLTGFKERLLADGIQPGDAEKIQAQNDLVLQAYRELLERRGFDLSTIRPTTRESFRMFGELQQIHFASLAGKHLRSNDLAALAEAAKSHDRNGIIEHAKQVAFELLTSPSPELAIDKVRLLRTALSRIPERAD